MRPPEPTSWRVLVPFDPREGISLKAAAARSGKSETTVRDWCKAYGLGRRVGGGVWVVSQVALSMHLDDDRKALAAYLAGNRSSAAVLAYYSRHGVPLPKLAFIHSATSTKSAGVAG
jgi:hypothetical protein